VELVPSVRYDVGGWPVTGAKGSAVVGWFTGSTRYELPSCIELGNRVAEVG
jgi:hypothetical protein